MCGNSILVQHNYFIPVYEEIEQELNAKYEEENDELMNYQHNFQDLSQVPHIENGTLACLQVKLSNGLANVTLHQGDTMIIPSTSNALINIPVPRSSLKDQKKIGKIFNISLLLKSKYSGGTNCPSVLQKSAFCLKNLEIAFQNKNKPYFIKAQKIFF